MSTRHLRTAAVLALFLLVVGCIRPTYTAVPYSSAGGAATVGDVYPPSAGGNVGTIIFVHGGGFTEGSRGDLLEYAGPVAGQTKRGWGVFSIDYRTSEPFPAAVLDLAAAVRFVRSAKARELGLNPARIVVVGHSAGGAVVADLALARNEGDAGPFGALPAVDGWIAAGGLLDFDVPGSITAHQAWRTGGNPAASPVNHLDAADPPGLLIHGADDRVATVGHAVRFIAKAQAVGAPLWFRIFNDRTSCSGHSPVCEASRPDLEGFLDRVARG